LSASAPTPHSIARNVAETLLYAIVGGLACGLSGIPAGYLTGAILIVSAAALLGRPMMLPGWFIRGIFVLIGISLGAVVTPETLNGMASYPASIAVLIAAMACVSIAGTAYLQIMHGWDRTAAYLASAPGGMSQVLVLAADLNSDLRAIAIVQSMRVVIVAVGLPSALSLLGLTGAAVRRSNGPLSWALADELAILVAASVVGASIAHRLKLPGGLMFGAMAASALLHGSGIVHAVVPIWVANAAAVALGAVIGARFTNTPLRLMLNYLAAAAGSFAVSVVIAALFGAALVAAMALPIAEVVMAYAPGSVDAMMLLALALHLDPVYVGAHHVVRILLVSLSMPFVARHVTRRKPGASPHEPGTLD
jgi:membrane AbrB-like protein